MTVVSSARASKTHVRCHLLGLRRLLEDEIECSDQGHRAEHHDRKERHDGTRGIPALPLESPHRSRRQGCDPIREVGIVGLGAPRFPVRTRVADVLEPCRQAFGRLEAEGGRGWSAAWRLVGPTGERGPGGPDSWAGGASAGLLELLEGIEPWGVTGPAAMAVRLGVDAEMAVRTAPLELYMARADIPRLRLRIVARGGAVVRPIFRGRVVPVPFGDVPVLPFARSVTTGGEGRLRLLDPAAARAAAVLRAGVELLAGAPLWRWHLVEVATLGTSADRRAAARWRERLTGWGLAPLANAVESLADVVVGRRGAPDAGAAVLLQAARGSRWREGMRLLEGRWRQLRFAVLAAMGLGRDGWC